MKSLYLLYISAGVALATIFFLYKSHKESMKKMETIQSLVSSIQQVPVMKYNDTEIKSLLHERCDEIENLIHFVNDDINKKIEKLNKVRELSNDNLNIVNKPYINEFTEDNSIHNNIADNNFFDNFLENDLSNGEENNDGDDEENGNNFKNKNNSLSQFTINNRIDILSEHKSSNMCDKSDNLDKNYCSDNLNKRIDSYDLDDNFKLDKHLNTDLKFDTKSVSKNDINNTVGASIEYSNNSTNQSASDNKTLKLNELKQIAKSKGLSPNGTKHEIINRLIANGHIF